MAYIRTVKTASGARAVQVVYSSHKGSRDIEHIDSAHNDVSTMSHCRAADRCGFTASRLVIR